VWRGREIRLTTARQKYIRLPPTSTTISSSCHRSLGRGRRFRSFAPPSRFAPIENGLFGSAGIGLGLVQPLRARRSAWRYHLGPLVPAASADTSMVAGGPRHLINRHLGGLQPIGPRAQRVTDEALVAADIRLNQGTPIVTRCPVASPWRPPGSAISCRCRSRLVGAVSAVALGTALERGGTMTAASG
jgi:hypothetical protein